MCNIYAIVGGVQLYWWCIWAGCARCTPSKSATSETNRFLGKASLYILFCNFMRLIQRDLINGSDNNEELEIYEGLSV